MLDVLRTFLCVGLKHVLCNVRLEMPLPIDYTVISVQKENKNNLEKSKLVRNRKQLNFIGCKLAGFYVNYKLSFLEITFSLHIYMAQKLISFLHHRHGP